LKKKRDTAVEEKKIVDAKKILVKTVVKINVKDIYFKGIEKSLSR